MTATTATAPMRAADWTPGTRVLWYPANGSTPVATSVERVGARLVAVRAWGNRLLWVNPSSLILRPLPL